ncbi:MAG TPA: LuxR C-terminal-related transcriptional regulator [Ktedonosporobacter sp.]|nr:LuxR C-terminal-related transcriptional regulator [Ktedonosporobacter sp.]
MERCIKKKLSATTGIVQNGALIYEQQGQIVTTTIGTLSWYVWLEAATTFAFEGSEGTFTAHKVRAGNRRGGWYWRAYRRHKGRLSNCYLGVSANLTLPCLCEAARRLATRSEETGTRKEAEDAEDGSRTPASSDILTSTLILNTKLALPRLPVQHVSRPHLLTLLEQGAQRPLTLVSAPAGSGKTTLLAEWAATTTLPVAWLLCESADNDPARFISYLLAQLARLDERLARVDQVDPFWYAHDYERVLTGPLNDLARVLQQDAVVLLDDYHLITTDAIHAALLFLLEHLPARLHLMIGTRVDPSLPLARLRARNQLSELRLEDLRFAAPEVEAFVCTMGLTLEAEALNLLQARTEGWIAGIQLLALALRKHPDATAFLRATGFTHRFLLDYVSEEVLAQQTDEMQRFLLHTCLLEQLTGPLCDAVTGEAGGEARLAVALQANLFVSALDETQTWYRYHPLFAEALRTSLRTRKPECVPEFYFRASCWYEQHHREEEACEYALLAGDQSRAATLLENLIPHLLEQGKVLRMQTFLSQLSSTEVSASPTLWVALISLPMLRTGIQETDMQTMASIIEQIEQQIQAHEQEEESAWAELRAGLPIMQAIAALVQGESMRALSLAQALELSHARSGSALSRFIALGKRGLLGIAYGARGDLAAVEQLFFAGSPSGSSSAAPPRHLAVVASLSELYEAHGQLRKLGQFYDDLFQELASRTASVSPILFALMQARYALLLYEWNRLADAELAVRQSEETAGKLEATHPIASLLSLLNCWTRSRIALARGESVESGNLSKQIGFSFSALSSAHQEPRVLGTLRARLALTCEQSELALRWAETCGLRIDDGLAPGDYAGYITLARVLLALGRSQRKSLRLPQAAFLLKRLRDLAVEQNWKGRLREIELLMALTLQAQGKTKQALLTLGAVLAQAEPEGYVRLFADEGPPLAHLLAQITAYTTASTGYIQQIQAVLVPEPREFADTARPTRLQPLPDPLSPREQEVLHDLARGFSNQQIADHLVISLHTAKRHVKHLLAKLIVTNRTQALARARELHLL